MSICRIFGLCILVLGIYGCSPPSAIVSVIDEAAAVMEEHPDSALSLLRSIPIDEIKDERVKAEYSLYLSQALDKNRIIIKSDSLISVAFKYFSKYGTPREKLLAYNYYARIHMNSDSLELAMPFLLEAEKYALQISDYAQLGLIYHRIGHIYELHHHLDRAEQEYNKSLKAFEAAGKGLQAAQMMHSLAKIKLLTNENELAIDLYTRAKQKAIEINDVYWIFESSRSISYLYLIRMEAPDKAMAELKSIAEYLPDGKYPSTFYPLLSQYHLKQNNLDSARWYAHSYLDAVKDNLSYSPGAYVLLQRIELAGNDYRKAFEHKSTYAILKDSMNKIHNQERIYEIEQKYRNAIIQQENELLHKEKKLLNIIAFLLILVVLILIAVFQYARRQLIKRKNQEIEEYQQYIENLKEDNNSLQKMQETLAGELDIHNAQEQALVQALEKRFSLVAKTLDIATITAGNTELFYKKVKENISALRKDHSFSEDLHKVVNSKYYGIIDYFKMRYPSLTNEDLDFIAFICLGVSRNSISAFYGYTNSNSVNTRSTRIRSKLDDFDQSIQIDTFIRDTICSLSAKSRQ